MAVTMSDATMRRLRRTGLEIYQLRGYDAALAAARCPAPRYLITGHEYSSERH